MRFSSNKFFQLLVNSYQDWRKISPGILAGALSYFASISLPPLVVILGDVMGHYAGSKAVYQEWGDTIGAKTFQSALHWINLARQTRTPTRTLISTLLLVFVASRVFAHLQTVYHILWDHPTAQRNFRQSFFKHTVVPLVLIVATGISTFVFVLVAPALGAMSLWMRNMVPWYRAFRKFLNFVFSMGFFTFVFGGLNLGLPPVSLRWSDVWPGALMTAVLFAIARGILTIYFRLKSFHVYGSAGSIVLVMIWVYFSAHIFLFGAVFTRRYILTYGSLAKPS
jgi:membrane protein